MKQNKYYRCLFLTTGLFFGFLSATPSEYAIDIAKNPLAFSIVREDSLLDLEIIKRYFPEEKVSVLMVASGGCTAAQLIAEARLKDITLVDPNLAQLELSRFKLQLLTLSSKKRLEILGYLPMKPEDRKSIISGYMHALDIDKDVFGNLDIISVIGFDFAGRYEQVFKQIRLLMAPYKKALEDILLLTDIDEQVRRISSETELGRALDQALDNVMSQENLVAIFGEKATANRVQDFSKHFAQRIRSYASKNLVASSPWFTNMLLGDFYHDVMFPWLTVMPSRSLPEISYIQGFMNDALAQSVPESFHVIHVSNIIDWLSPDEAKLTLELAYRALKPGGVIIIRQLNSNLDIFELGKDFLWDKEASQEFLHNDRSFFYRNFFIGFKERPSATPQVKAMADSILQETPVIDGIFFQDLEIMDKEVFKHVQSQFFFAVDYFSLPMAALIARLPLHEQRIDILHNIVEEHGDFSFEHYHSTMFKRFLNTIGITNEYMDNLLPSPVVTMFNYTLMGACAHEDPLVAIACDGIIEYAFADISALIAKKVIERGWVVKNKLVHYNLHAAIDKIHAEEFFKILEPYMNEPEKREKIIAGLRLGAYIFNRLYTDLYTEALTRNLQSNSAQ